MNGRWHRGAGADAGADAGGTDAGAGAGGRHLNRARGRQRIMFWNDHDHCHHLQHDPADQKKSEQKHDNNDAD